MYKKKYTQFQIVGRYDALVVDVYDGDTITVVFDPFPDSQYSKQYWFKVRILGIDTPEIKIGKNVPDRVLMKNKAVQARDYLRNLILDKHVMIDISGTDKYGRLLADIYPHFRDPQESLERIGGLSANQLDGEQSISNIMITGGYAVAYDGGTKYDWSQNIEYPILSNIS